MYARAILLVVGEEAEADLSVARQPHALAQVKEVRCGAGGNHSLSDSGENAGRLAQTISGRAKASDLLTEGKTLVSGRC